MRSCADCGQPHETGYEALECTVRVVRAENRRMAEALSKLDGAKVIGTAAEPGMGHAAMWDIVRWGLHGPDGFTSAGGDDAE